MTIEKKPHRRLCRRQKHFQVPIGVSFRQQHLQVEAMKKKMKLLKKSHEKERVELTELEAMFTHLEARFTQLRADRRHALEERAWTQTCLDTVEVWLVAEDIADQLRDPLSGH